MDSVIDIGAARALVADTVLWPRVRDFLWDFAPQVHPSWLENLGREALNERREDETATSHVSRLMSSPRVKRFILSALGVDPCFHVFPKDDWSRLTLLDGQTLESIAKWLGALVCADALRRVTDGATVRALKAELPGVYPEVFGYTAYFAGFDFAATGAENAKTPDEVLSVGCGLLSALLDACPAPLLKRFTLKLPQKLCDLCVPSDEKKERPSTGGAVKKLLRLKFPEAYKLCC